MTTAKCERFEHKVEIAEGRSEFQLSRVKPKLKFENVAAYVLPPDRVMKAYEAIISMKRIANIHELTSFLATSVFSVEQAVE